MISIYKPYLLILSIFCSTFSFGQGAFDVVEPAHIKTVTLRPLKPDQHAPILRLGETFRLSFDDLEADQKYYYYKIDHFDYNWNPSGLSPREFIKGYDGDRIRDEQNSFNTLQFYTHYSVDFPNRNTQLKLSGNYMISILDENDYVVFTRRFVLYEPQVNVSVSAHRSREIEHLDTKQNIQFTINHTGLNINNPKQEIKTVIMQNGNWETAVINLPPQYMRGNELIYKYLDATNFWGGNEFLYFDSKAVKFANIYIKRVEYGPVLYHTILYTNGERRNLPYTLFQDINGNYLVRNVDGRQGESHIDADYTWVFFSLQTTQDLTGKRVFVNGAFNNWQNNGFNEMIYNPETGLYEIQILMKQGFYNYQFVTLDQNLQFSNYDIDGSFFQTENDYQVLVYYRPFGSRYDRVIGYGQVSSRRILN